MKVLLFTIFSFVSLNYLFADWRTLFSSGGSHATEVKCPGDNRTYVDLGNGNYRCDLNWSWCNHGKNESFRILDTIATCQRAAEICVNTPEILSEGTKTVCPINSAKMTDINGWAREAKDDFHAEGIRLCNSYAADKKEETQTNAGKSFGKLKLNCQRVCGNQINSDGACEYKGAYKLQNVSNVETLPLLVCELNNTEGCSDEVKKCIMDAMDGTVVYNEELLNACKNGKQPAVTKPAVVPSAAPGRTAAPKSADDGIDATKIW